MPAPCASKCILTGVPALLLQQCPPAAPCSAPPKRGLARPTLPSSAAPPPPLKTPHPCHLCDAARADSRYVVLRPAAAADCVGRAGTAWPLQPGCAGGRANLFFMNVLSTDTMRQAWLGCLSLHHPYDTAGVAPAQGRLPISPPPCPRLTAWPPPTVAQAGPRQHRCLHAVQG